MSYIPLFCYKLCKEKGINPEDLGKCEGWLTAVSYFEEDLIGRYRYRVSWPDGKHTVGELSIASDKIKPSISNTILSVHWV